MTIPDGGKRVALVLLAIPNLVAGLWAIVAPQSWYDDFPGWAPSLVSAFPPYNEHLVTDAGAGLLASGVVALVAAWWLRRDITVVAMTAYLAFSAPHGIFHLLNPSDLLSTGENVVNDVTLTFAMVVPAALLFDDLRGDARRHRRSR